MLRKEVKVHEDAPGIRLTYDLNNHKIVDLDDEYHSRDFKKYNIKQIIYDQHVIACFYRTDEHPYANLFTEKFIILSKSFAQFDMTVILDSFENDTANILIYPNEKVKLFKQ